MTVAAEQHIDPRAREIYVDAMTRLMEAGVDFLVGGAYAYERYTGIARHTKDFDIFLTHEGTESALRVLRQAGYLTELTFPHWLGKAYKGEDFIDLIFGAGNGVARVDEMWFQNAVRGEVLGLPVNLVPAEEMIWSKAFIMERERYDGADVAHVLKCRAAEMDWRRLVRRFRPYPRILLTHLLLFGFIYPDCRRDVPEWVMKTLLKVVEREMAAEPPSEKICYGTLISREQYLTDIGVWGYHDARLQAPGTMTPEDIAFWTAAIDGET